jgi:TIGR03009 family protein
MTKTVCCSAVLGLGLLCFSGSLCGAAVDGSMESTLAQWENASQNCRCLDADVTIFRYDVFSGDRPQVTRGRLYYEAPHVGRYEVWANERKPTANDWPNISEAIIWGEKETLWIDGRTRTCRKISVAKVQSYMETLESYGEAWWYSLFRQSALRALGPQQWFPLVIGIRASEIQERFNVAMKNTAGQLTLKAVPKQRLEKAEYREIDVILDSKTYLTYAVRVVSADGKDCTDFVFNGQRINEFPSDRNQLINPNLLGLRLIDDL